MLIGNVKFTFTSIRSKSFCKLFWSVLQQVQIKKFIIWLQIMSFLI